VLGNGGGAQCCEVRGDDAMIVAVSNHGLELLVLALVVVAVGALLGAVMSARGRHYAPPRRHIDRRSQPRLPGRSARA
jgi:hypothetical protein